MEDRNERRPRLFTIAGTGMMAFGILWFVGGGEFLDRPDTTLMMGMPFLVAGVVLTLMGLLFGSRH